MMDEIYCYPTDYRVLRNKFGFRDAKQLDYFERELVADQIEKGCPSGDFDLAHLQSIHRHLFQDVYDWAGEIRTLEISKGGSQFLPRQFIETGMNDVHKRLETTNYLQGLDVKEFSRLAGEVLGDINHIHPFRDGNGRTQLQYLSQLAEQAGHEIDLTKLDPENWLEASIRSHHADYAPMQDSIHNAIEQGQNQHEARNLDKEGAGPNVSQRSYADSYNQAQARTNDLYKNRDKELE